MSITFRCERCRAEVKAPDTAAGKRGKCPFCEHTTYIPTPEVEDDLPLAPVDEQEEQRLAEARRKLLEAEKELLHESAAKADQPPLEQREDLTSDDVQHLVVNYCIDMANGKLDRAEMYMLQLRRFGSTGVAAVDEFLSGQAVEAGIDFIPRRVLHGFLLQLKDRLTGSGN